MTPAPRILALLALLVAALLVAPGSASAKVACGSVLTEDTVLTEDVVCGEGNALRAPDGGWEEYALLIGADDVTLNLNGHVVTGSWSWVGIGVYGHDGVAIRNGTTPHVTLVNTSDSTLTGLEAAGGGFALRTSDRNRIANSYVHGEGGLSLERSDGNVIEDNKVIGENAVWVVNGSDRNIVRRNTVCAGMNNPIAVDGSNDNLLEHNVIPDPIPGSGGERCRPLSEHGIVVAENTAGTRLIRNSASGLPGDGIRVHSSATTLVGNTANFNGGLGINAVPGVKSGVNYARDNGDPLQCMNVICVRDPAVAGPPGPVGPLADTAPPEAPARDHRASPPVVDRTAPLMSLAGKATQKLGKAIRLTVGATSEDLWVSATGTVSLGGAARVYRLGAVKDRHVARGAKATLKLALPAKARDAIRRALKKGRKVKAVLTVRIKDAAGNATATKRTIKLTR